MSVLDLENIDEVEFEEFFEQIHSHLHGDEEMEATCPDGKIEARKWLAALIRLEDKMDYLKNDYKKYLKKRYLDPVDKKVLQLDSSREFLREGLLQYLIDAEERNINFPDIGTVSKVKAKKKIIYPDDESSFAETLHESGQDEFVKTKYSIDKTAISKYFKGSGQLPVSGLATEDSPETISVRRAKIEEDEE